MAYYWEHFGTTGHQSNLVCPQLAILQLKSMSHFIGGLLLCSASTLSGRKKTLQFVSPAKVGTNALSHVSLRVHSALQGQLPCKNDTGWCKAHPLGDLQSD